MRNLTYDFSHGTHRTTTHGQPTPSLRDAPSEEGVGLTLRGAPSSEGVNNNGSLDGTSDCHQLLDQMGNLG